MRYNGTPPGCVTSTKVIQMLTTASMVGSYQFYYYNAASSEAAITDEPGRAHGNKTIIQKSTYLRI